MVARIIDGKAVAKRLRQQIAQETEKLVRQGARRPGLAVVLVGDDPASKVYVGNKKKACHEVGFEDFSYTLPADVPEERLLSLIDELNRNPAVDGILVQLPVPEHIDAERIIESIAPEKDVDGFHPYNMGRLATRHPLLAPCTPRGVMTLLRAAELPIRGQNAVVVGASNIVGVPMALELLNERATVSICHSATRDLLRKVAEADILVVGVGIPQMIKGEWIKPGAVVIDVGINRLEDGRLVGDVEFEAARERAGWITPVPGGVGPMTIATLLENTLNAYKKRNVR